jgi:hypothetical protein
VKRLERLRTSLNASLTNPLQRRAAIASITIELHGTWAHFARTLYLSAMMGCRSSTGVKVYTSVTVDNPQEAIGVAMQYVKPKVAKGKALSGPWPMRDEPSWHDLDLWLRIIDHVKCSAMPSIRTGVSIPTRVYKDLTVFRNYFAHRNADTFDKAQALATNYTISPKLTPTQILVSKPYGSPNILLEQWILDVETSIDLICTT